MFVTKVIYNTAASFNGYIADANNSLNWLFSVGGTESPDHDAFLESIGALVSGSTTYEWVLEHEDLMNNPQKWPEFYGDRPYFVFTSRTLQKPEGGDIRFISGSVKENFEEIENASNGKDIWLIGGGELVGQFYDEGLLDQIQISIVPTALNGGAPLLPREIYPDKLKLTRVDHFDQFAHLTYSVVK